MPVLGPEDLSFDDMARVMSDAMAQGMLDMVIAKDHGIDKASKRTPESTTPTSFRQWCKDALRPWVLS